MDKSKNFKEYTDEDLNVAQKKLEQRVDFFAQKELETRAPMTYPFSLPTQLTQQNLNHFSYRPDWCTQFWILYKRANMQLNRAFLRIIIKFIATIAIILFGSILYFRVFFQLEITSK